LTSYSKTIKDLRKQRDQRTRSNLLHWLNLVGLFWLNEGENTFGRDESNSISLSGFSTDFSGSFNFMNGEVKFEPAKDIQYSSQKPEPESRPLISDADKDPDLITIGSITMKIIIRGEVTLVRVWDRESPVGKQFKGFKYYPVKDEYRVAAKYERYNPPKTAKQVDIIGTETERIILGRVKFTLHGMDCSLEAEKSEEKLLLHFTDSTSKVTTYGGGRKFSIDQPISEDLIIDFNLAENWPCAYTPYATCPVVPQENKLSIKIEAGELKYFE